MGWWWVVIILPTLAALYFVGSGSYPLLDPDEPVYGQVAREMAARGDWLSPHFNGALWFDKPPLFYWLSALSVRLFGVSEFACRLPAALAACGVVALVYAFAAPSLGRRVALLSALVMATCFQQIMLARAAVTDMTFACCLTLALLCYRRWLGDDDRASSRYASSRRAMLWALGCGVATGLAALTKGPVAPLLLSLTFVIHACWCRIGRRLLSVGAALAVLCALAVGLPWYVAMYRLHGQAFVQGFLVANNLTRFLKAEHAGQTGKWYAIFRNIPILLLFFFPWSAFVPQAIVQSWRASAKTPARPDSATVTLRLAMVWSALVFVFFSISKTQLVTYIFPMYPMAAVLVGRLWSRIEFAPVQRGLARGLWALLIGFLLLTVGVVVVLHRKHHEAHSTPLILVAGLLLVLSCALAIYMVSCPPVYPGEENAPLSASSLPAARAVTNRLLISPLSGAVALGGGMLLLTLWLVGAVLPRELAGESARDLVRQLPLQPATVVVYGANAPSVLFYLRNRSADRYINLIDARPVIALLRQPSPVFVVCRPDVIKKFIAAGAHQWVHSGRLVLLSNATARHTSRHI